MTDEWKGQLATLRREVRRALAEYMRTEGCSCCRDIEGHAVAAARLAKLLRVPRYSDGSGFNFSRFREVRDD
jgi:methionine aminopeptidase